MRPAVGRRHHRGQCRRDQQAHDRRLRQAQV